jgi:Palmitoyl protein thioesterase
MKLSIALLLGLVSADQLTLPEVQCHGKGWFSDLFAPFHSIGGFFKRVHRVHHWGKLEMEVEGIEKDEEISCPFRRLFSKKKRIYNQYENDIRNSKVVIDTDSQFFQKRYDGLKKGIHQCPIMKYFFTPSSLAQKHDSPFYQSPDDLHLNSTAIPTAVFHGFGDACVNPGMSHFGSIIAQGTGGKVHCIEVGAPSFGEVFNNFESIA